MARDNRQPRAARQPNRTDSRVKKLAMVDSVKSDRALGVKKRGAQNAYLVDSPKFKGYERYVKHQLFVEESVPTVKPLSVRHARQMHFQLSADPVVRTFFDIAWLTSQRPACVFRLRKENIHVNKDRTVTTLFVEGKGVWSRGRPFCITTVFPCIATLRRMLLAKQKFVFSNRARIYATLLASSNLFLLLQRKETSSLPLLAALAAAGRSQPLFSVKGERGCLRLVQGSTRVRSIGFLF